MDFQLLGIDRDTGANLNIAGQSDEKNEAVMLFIKELIAKVKKNKRKIGICGQAPSDFPEFAEFLVKEKIDSISLIPDSVLKTIMTVAKTEKKYKNRGILSLFF